MIAVVRSLLARAVLVASKTTLPPKSVAATPFSPKTTKLSGRWSVRRRPADDASPLDPPTAQNRCNSPKATHQVTAAWVCPPDPSF